MTEEEWLQTDDYSQLMRHMEQVGPPERKVLPFVVGVGRHGPCSVSDPSQDRMNDGLELYADGDIDRETLDQIYVEEAVYEGAPFGHFTAADAAHAVEEEERRIALLLARDIFGNPFRPVAFAPTWRTTDAAGLARSMYDSSDFAAMPILADALEDAGCDNADVLAHCRGDGPHVRGCWVVDLVLGKT